VAKAELLKFIKKVVCSF